MIHPDLLKRYRLFHCLSDNDISAIAPLVRVIEATRGEVVVEQNSPHSGPYLVYSGMIKTGLRSPSGKEAVLALFGPGESFEDCSLFFEFHSGRAVAVEDSVVYNLPKNTLIDLMQRRPIIAFEYLRNLTSSMMKLRFGIMNSMLNDAERKLSTYLMSLVDGAGKSPKVTLPAKKSVIAAYLGMTAETFSRTLQALRQSGCIRTDGRTVVVRDLNALSTRAVRF